LTTRQLAGQPDHGNYAAGEVKFISPRRASDLTSLSMRQLDRLEDVGKFPLSIKLGEGRNGRKAYVEHEVLEWNCARLAERNARAG
jgi:predicted DNA-binding transcriptional regulator AlpA